MQNNSANKKPKLNSLAKNVWRYSFGNRNKGKDAFGLDILKCAYGDVNSKYGWTIDHTYPLNPDEEESNGNIGRDCIENMQPMHIWTNEQKGNKLSGMVKIEYDGQFLIKEFKIIPHPFYQTKSISKIGLINIIDESKSTFDTGDFYCNNRCDYYVYDGYILISSYSRWYFYSIDFSTKDGFLKKELSSGYLELGNRTISHWNDVVDNIDDNYHSDNHYEDEDEDEDDDYYDDDDEY